MAKKGKITQVYTCNGNSCDTREGKIKSGTASDFVQYERMIMVCLNGLSFKYSENTASCAIQVQVLVIVIQCRSLVAHRDIHCMCTLLCINIVETNIVNAHAAIL